MVRQCVKDSAYSPLCIESSHYGDVVVRARAEVVKVGLLGIVGDTV